MSRKLNVIYSDAKPIAVRSICNFGGESIVDVIYGIDDYVVVRDITNDHHLLKVNYSNKGPFINLFKRGVYIDEFLKI